MINKLVNKEIRSQLNQVKQDVNNAIRQGTIEALDKAQAGLSKFTKQYTDELATNVSMGDIVLELNYKIDKAKIRLLHSADATKYWNDYNS